jgi:ribosomal protein S18 acetylase RimI-like enzyme
MPLTFRPIRADDEAFLYKVYASTRLEELAVLDWAEEQRETFLTMQFNAQHKYYQGEYADAAYQIILLDGEQIGRLYLLRGKDEFLIIDIAILPEYRNRGIGTSLLKDILAEAEAAKLPVHIHVEQYNPALHLYTRLGFQPLQQDGIYFLMEWQPGAAPQNVAQSTAQIKQNENAR